MKKTTTTGFLAAIFVALFALNLSAQGQKTNVCIIDLAEVFRNHPTFNNQLNKLQQDAEAFKAQVTQKQKSLAAERDAVLKLKPDSAEFQAGESRLAQSAAKLEVEARNQIKEFAKREAMLHFDTYQQIKTLIGRYCAQQSISIVLTFSGTKVDTSNPESIMRNVNSNIVFHAPQKDLTPTIIQYLAQVSAAAQKNNK